MVRIYTLGPAKSCHHHATWKYLEFQGIEPQDIILVDDLVAAAAEAADRGDSYVLQCSAHLNVHLVTEKFRDRLQVVDTFILPTQSIAVVKRKDVKEPRSLSLPEPTMGYNDKNAWNELIFETTKPVVEKQLLEGVYDAGVAYSRSALEHPEKLEIMQEIGEVVTTWLLYGPRPRYSDTIIASPYPELHDVLP
ncbi:hypothetical protein IVA98_00795 [Bradyrhizobium sp. 160]|uniref:hypothetical protein n=1 Tax=Bradyrhizobium sp. 160 TaxID=2782634 RepID=UPI001FF77A96|nr:hypothetical protein [Bradyrhizobium sp. 160]MCK1621815.1 hypothetical protein [Bradyrhizobium sp. 160]